MFFAVPAYHPLKQERRYSPPPASRRAAGTVQAGHWVEADEVQDADYPVIPVTPDPRYPADLQWAYEVRGASMNKVFPAGSHAKYPFTVPPE